MARQIPNSKIPKKFQIPNSKPQNKPRASAATTPLNSIELYNLATDLSEKTDLSKREPKIAAALLAKLHQWRDAMRAPMPVPNPDYHNAAAKKKKGGNKKVKSDDPTDEG